MKIQNIFCLTFMFFLMDLENTYAMEATQSIQGKAKIYRQGKGEIDIKGLFNEQWPVGYSLKKEGGYQVKRLSTKITDNIPKDKSLRQSWAPKNFTSLKDYKTGEYLSSFRFVVHGLELKHLVEGLESDDMSFDDFVHTQLNSQAPLKDDFITYYPYFFHKKTIISASIINENLTATFGDAGFILTVPVQNYVCGGQQDIHTATDIEFYKPLESFNPESLESLGEISMYGKISDYHLPTLEELLSKKKIEKPTDEDMLRANAKKMLGRNPTLSEMENIKKIFEEVMGVQTKKLDLLYGQDDGKTSIYNEIAINPAFVQGNTTFTPKITGVFLRTDLNKLENFLTKTYVKKLLQITEAFDLPVVLINDGEKYETKL